MGNRALAALGLLALTALRVCAQGTAQGARALDKKLIEYGWDVPFTDFVRDHIREMEKRPFDGLVFKLRGGGNVLTPRPLDPAGFAPDFAAGPQIPWQTFTDNFVILWAASDQDWFDDAHWQAIEQNARLMARAARAARCVGVCFDHEPYGPNPWAYTGARHHAERTFAEYEAMVRQRGGQFMRALESEFPGLTVLTFFQLSYFGELLVPADPADRAQKLSSQHYALLPAFLNGMLEAATPAASIVDGNESAYYYTDSRSYFEVAHRITQRARLLVDPALWERYRRQVQVGQALYIDQYFGLRSNVKVLGHYMPAEDQQRWFEHNVYWALYTTDRYVWCYSERMNWWTGKDVPAGCEDAIRSARRKLEAGRPLGFDLAPLVANAQARQREEVASRVTRRSATIPRRRAETPVPAVDGRMDDPAWAEAAALEPFAPLASRPQTSLRAATLAWVLWDPDALYVAVRCHEPRPEAMRPGGTAHDDAGIWQGDDIEFLISPPGKTLPFAHFMVTPGGLAWDALHNPDADLSFSPAWQRAVTVESDRWTVEMAFPWVVLGMTPPEPGTSLRANLCRQRTQDSELSAWSPMAEGFLEHELFGTWIFH